VPEKAEGRAVRESSEIETTRGGRSEPGNLAIQGHFTKAQAGL